MAAQKAGEAKPSESSQIEGEWKRRYEKERARAEQAAKEQERWREEYSAQTEREWQARQRASLEELQHKHKADVAALV